MTAVFFINTKEKRNLCRVWGH